MLKVPYLTVTDHTGREEFADDLEEGVVPYMQISFLSNYEYLHDLFSYMLSCVTIIYINISFYFGGWKLHFPAISKAVETIEGGI